MNGVRGNKDEIIKVLCQNCFTVLGTKNISKSSLTLMPGIKVHSSREDKNIVLSTLQCKNCRCCVQLTNINVKEG